MNKDLKWIEECLHAEISSETYANIWPIFRNYVRQELTKKSLHIIERRSQKISFLKGLFFGCQHWFGSYDYLFFTMSHGRKKIGDERYDVFVDSIIGRLGKDRCLVIETPTSKHYKSSTYKSSKVVSFSASSSFKSYYQKNT